MKQHKAPPPVEVVVYHWAPPGKHWTRAEFDAAVAANSRRLLDLCRDVQAEFGAMGVMQMLVQAAGRVSCSEGVPAEALINEFRMTLRDEFDLELPELPGEAVE